MQKPIIQLGNPMLRQKSTEITNDQLRSKKVRQLIKDLKLTLTENDGLGLAAPQIEELKRTIVISIPPELLGHKKAGISLQVLINPKILSRSEETSEDWEGCLSFDYLRGLVPRHNQVTIEAWDEQGKMITIEAHDLFARVLQHEIDHLDGILYIDRITDIKSLISTEEFEKQYQEKSL